MRGRRLSREFSELVIEGQPQRKSMKSPLRSQLADRGGGGGAYLAFFEVVHARLCFRGPLRKRGPVETKRGLAAFKTSCLLFVIGGR